ncbi:hypothetical protein [Parapedobacter composti]|uniref:hypothetical protein n=1 Tax=Parapedobacter composti TaxID=623281 RepID=UPI00147AE8F1|nr:hypothetical protein [Parapedobacter composti]
MAEHGQEKGRHGCIWSSDSRFSPVFLSTYLYPSFRPYPCDIRVYLGKKAKKRHFTEGCTANVREKGTFGGAREGVYIGAE